ncbi:hypothetical protein [Cryobacterium psychrophilum]|uniref:Uncharacterized protein n=1 Tax=Cryobacterium psychrophilum TaxID=41988 RepID=A0A4Y8KSU6_9MICO|nr:hypothetical protein [Cryobacterium psychrophilum]TDW31333.1 hypothetical protein EDD25_3141 [Cryobacterium psychrophilum]TFD78390.1 hypothetical protein E3T53_09280 [Cryobacterium psychrophilum]
MQAHRLTINTDSFHLPADYDVAGLKSALAAAARHGGGFVDLVSTSGTHLALLVTPSSTVRFEALPDFDDLDVYAARPLLLDGGAFAFYEEDYALE